MHKPDTITNDYPSYQSITLKFRNQDINIITKVGIPHWNLLAASQALIAEHIEIKSHQKVAYIGYGNGAGLIYLACNHPEAQFWGIDPNSVALEAASRSLEVNALRNVELTPLPSLLENLREKIDIVIIEITKGRELNRRWLIEGFHLISQNGRIFLSGSNDEGIRSVSDDLEALYNKTNVVDYKKGNRLISANEKRDFLELPDWFSAPGLSPGTWKEIQAPYLPNHMTLSTLPGLFSANLLDRGTCFLLDHVSIKPGEVILDFGCGWGAIGIWAAIRSAGQVDMIDNNLLAIACAERNCVRLGLKNVAVFASDNISAVMNKRYDCILSNPPFHIGRKVDYSITNHFISQSSQVLKKHGKLIIVANSFIRYDRKLQEYFKRVSCLAADANYQIWQAEN
jgi:16S rRNA (guanine1207-N2)-methyltransferase